MEKWKVVVLEVVLAIVVVQLILNAMYLQTPGFWTGFSLLSWNLLVLSADTSFIGMYYGLKAYIGALRILGKKRWWLVIIEASVFVISFQAIMNVVFFASPISVVGVFNSAAWNLLALSASTSVLAMYYCIQAYIAAVKAMRTVKVLNIDFIKDMLSGQADESSGKTKGKAETPPEGEGPKKTE